MSDRIRRLLEGFLSQDLDEQYGAFHAALVLIEMRSFGPNIPASEIEQYRLLSPEAVDSLPLNEEEEAGLLEGLVDLFLSTRRSGPLFLIGKARMLSAAPAFSQVLARAGDSLSGVESRDILIGLDKGIEPDPVDVVPLRTVSARAFLERWSRGDDPELADIGRRLGEQIFRTDLQAPP